MKNTKTWTKTFSQCCTDSIKMTKTLPETFSRCCVFESNNKNFCLTIYICFLNINLSIKFNNGHEFEQGSTVKQVISVVVLFSWYD